MAVPTLNVQLAFGTTPFGALSWAAGDISAFVQDRVTIRRGRRSVFNDVEAGSATVTLSNTERLFDPENTSSPHISDLRPMVPIRITATWSGTTYPLFQGYVTDFQPRYLGGTRARLDLICVDGFEPLSRIRLGTSAAPLALVQAAGDTRIDDVLDAGGWPALERTIDSTAVQIQASTLESVPTLEHLQTVARSLNGVFFISNDGKATFQGRSYRGGLSSIGTFGDAPDGSELPYAELLTSYGAAQIYNRIELQNTALPGETRDVIVAEDTGSQGDYLTRVLSRTSLLLDSEVDTQSIADELLGQNKDPKVRAQRMVIDPSVRDATTWPIVLGADLSSRLVLHRLGLNGGSLLDLTGFVEGINWDISQGAWRVAWDLSSI